MAEDLQASYDASQEMAAVHRGVAADVDELAGGMPTSLDGGEGGPFILTGLALLGEAAGQLSQVHTSAAERLASMVDLVKGIDDSAEGDFRGLEQQVDS